MRDAPAQEPTGQGRRRRLPAAALAGLAVLVAAAFGAALLVLPIKAWMNQRHSLESSRERLAALDDANASLQADINRLKTKSGIAQAAREELGVVRKGEKAYRVLAMPELSLDLPNNWLNGTLRSLITERIATIGGPARSTQGSDTLVGSDAAPTDDTAPAP